MTQTKLGCTYYEIYNRKTGQKIKESISYTATRGMVKFAVLMGIDGDIVVYANGKDITEQIHKDIAKGN